MPQWRTITLLGLAFLLLPSATHAHHSTLPLPISDDLWDISQGTVITAHSALHASQSLDARDMLGGTFGGLSSENGNLVFSDQLPLDTVHRVEWRTPEPITLESFRLFARHNTSRPLNSTCTFPDARVRGFKQFRLFAKTVNGTWEQIYDLNPLVNGHYHIANEEYQGILPFDRPTSGDPILHEAAVTPIYAQEFRAEFVQGGDPSDTTQCALWRQATGPRVVELDGFGSTQPPEADEPEPVIIIPGMLASQNKKVLYEDQEGGAWKFVFGGNVYKGLIKKLEQAGFVQGETLFIAHYDWRLPVSESAPQYLAPVIVQAKQASGSEKVDIIAHSMGGLLARSYIQGESYGDDVDQLITLGSPHQGAADAYVAWEGGKFPVGWDSGTRARVFVTERALKKTRGLPTIQRPLSFRTFFPGLKDVLPTETFTQKNGQPTGPETLIEKNTFLATLNTGINNLAAKLGSFHTIAGKIEKTLEKVTLSTTRSPEDIALQRWRDGAPNPDPPLPDSSEGDNRVLISSAQISGNKLTIENATHIGLLDKAQNQLLDILGVDPVAESFPSDPEPKSIFGILILSPLQAAITGPSGQILSPTQNDFGETNAEYDDDPNDPNDPQEITILNPPPGQYTIAYTGTGSGAYTTITCYADQDEDMCTSQEGTTQPGQKEVKTVNITTTTFEPAVDDVVKLICQLPDTIKTLLFEKHFKMAGSKLHGLATRTCSFAKNWQKEVDKQKSENKQVNYWRSKTQSDFSGFVKELEKQIEAKNLDDHAIREIVSLREQISQAL